MQFYNIPQFNFIDEIFLSVECIIRSIIDQRTNYKFTYIFALLLFYIYFALPYRIEINHTRPDL